MKKLIITILTTLSVLTPYQLFSAALCPKGQHNVTTADRKEKLTFIIDKSSLETVNILSITRGEVAPEQTVVGLLQELYRDGQINNGKRGIDPNQDSAGSWLHYFEKCGCPLRYDLTMRQISEMDQGEASLARFASTPNPPDITMILKRETGIPIQALLPDGKQTEILWIFNPSEDGFFVHALALDIWLQTGIHPKLQLLFHNKSILNPNNIFDSNTIFKVAIEEQNTASSQPVLIISQAPWTPEIHENFSHETCHEIQVLLLLSKIQRRGENGEMSAVSTLALLPNELHHEIFKFLTAQHYYDSLES